MELRSSFLFEAEIEVGPIESLGRMDGRDRRVIAILGGKVKGPRVEAEILPGGADWQTLWADGLADIEARYMCRTGDGANILIHSTGTRHGPPEVIAALGRGEDVDPSLYYFRTALRFETLDPRYRFLARLIAVGVAKRQARKVILTAHEVL